MRSPGASAGTTSTTGASATISASGAGAHSKISFPHRVVRQVRYRQPASYLERAARGDFLSEHVEVGRRDLPFEFMLNALRLTDGVPASLFCERTGLPASAIDSAAAGGGAARPASSATRRGSARPRLAGAS